MERRQEEKSDGERGERSRGSERGLLYSILTPTLVSRRLAPQSLLAR